MNIVVGVTGATGAVYAVRLLEALHAAPDVRIHLVISDWGRETLALETGYDAARLGSLAECVYPVDRLDAAIASGSFLTDAMVIVPCSMKTLASIANGTADNLVSRAADVAIKEGRKLILCPRETPLSAIHLENMLKLSRLGVRMVPPMPSFYHHPETIDDIVDHLVMKLMDQLGVPWQGGGRWNGA